jgi:O-antigen/teichoic acid export membrane protein
MSQDPQKQAAKEITQRIDQAKSYVLSVGETTVDIGVSLLLLVLIGRSYGPGGLGVYSFLLSVFVIVSFLAEFGVGKYVERELAVGDRKDVQGLLSETRGVILLSSLLGGLGTLLLGKWIVGASLVARGAWPGFCVLAVAVPLNLYSGFQASVLHGRGEHGTASRAGLVKRLILLGSVYLLSGVRIRADLLVTAFIFSEIAHIILVKRAVRMPSIAATLKKLGTAGTTIRESLQYYFTHEGLRVLFFVDFFILGFFVSAVQEGSYAEASVLARLFLIIPLGAAPLYRVRVYRSTSLDHERIFADSRRTAARFFSLHSVIALVFLLYFPDLLRTVFKVQGDIPVFFGIFSLLLPGLLLFSSTVVLEPLFNIGSREQGLNRIALRVFVVNAFLNFYLIPYAGVYGAATATTVSLVIYFVLFVREIGSKGDIPMKAYLLSGALVYVAYHILDSVRIPFLLVLLIIVTVLPVMFWILGLYEQNTERTPRPGSGQGTQNAGEDLQPQAGS